jgi:hypothetical protein
MLSVKREESIERLKSEEDADVDSSTEDELSSSPNATLRLRAARQHRKLNSSRWTPEEDEKLKSLVKQFGPKTWHVVAKHMSNGEEEGQGSSHHTAVQCMCRYKNVLDVCVRKGPWTEEEDELLRQLVEAAPGPHKIKWREVAEHLSGRLGKQCRERW